MLIPHPLLQRPGWATTSDLLRDEDYPWYKEDFLTKPVRKEVLFAAIERALARDAQNRRQRARRGEMSTRFEALTPREREVLGLVLWGQLNKQIAFEVGISGRTDKMHRANLTAKLQVQSVAELSHLAHELGMSLE